MVMKTLTAFAACMFGFAGMCDAAQIASPSIYASPSQKVAFCAVYNGDITAQTVHLQLSNEAGAIAAGDNCGSSLPAGGFCSIAKIGISNISAYACSATAVSVVHLRGSMILRDGSDTSLRSALLR
jgi:hypothetical protein